MMKNDKNRRILIVSDAWKPQVNGVVRTYEYLGEELEKMGHTVRIIGPRDFPLHIPMPGYAEIDLALFPYQRLSGMIDGFAPDSIHIATEGPLGRAARRYCLKKGRRFNTAYHTQFPDYVARRVAKFFPKLEDFARRKTDDSIREFHRPAAALITTTESLEQELIARGYKTPLYQMARGVPLDLFCLGPATLLQDLPRPIAMYVGRVAIEKNLDAFLSMPWEGSKVVVGHGPSLEELQAKYKDAHFTGKKIGQELADHLRSADIFVFPSRTDTFGIVLLEALGCGLPVAAYDVTGPRDIITEPFLGALDSTDLAAAARKALAVKDEKQARRAYVEKHYSWEAAARRFIEILDDSRS